MRYLWDEIKENLTYNKSRFILTGLGIGIGNIAVVIIIIVSSSFSNSITADFATSAQIALMTSNETNLLVEEVIEKPEVAQAISMIPNIEGVKEWKESEAAKTITIINDKNSQVQEVEIDFANVSVVSGKEFSNMGENEVIIKSNDEYETFYKIGDLIYVNGIAYEVIGFTNQTGNNYAAMFFPENKKEEIEYHQSVIKGNYQLTVKDGYSLREVRETVLQELNKSLEDMQDAHFVDFSDEMSAALEEMIEMVGIILVFIAAISLLVAAINVVNIMYITAMEKTHEIAIYRALGMKKITVLAQFLLQSSVIVVVCSVLGYVVGVVLSAGIVLLMGFPLYVPWWSVVVIMIMGVVIGVLAGYKPAEKAADVSPAILLK